MHARHVAALAAVLAACSSSSGSSTPASTGPGGTSGASCGAPMACNLVSPSDVMAAFGASFSMEPQMDMSSSDVAVTACQFDSQGSAAVFVNVLVRCSSAHDNDPSQVEMSMMQLFGNVKAESGVGDQAFYGSKGINAQLSVLRGTDLDVQVTVTGSLDDKTKEMGAIAIATKVLSAIP